MGARIQFLKYRVLSYHNNASFTPRRVLLAQAKGLYKLERPVQRLGGGRACNKSFPVLGGNGTKIAPPKGWSNAMNSGQACRPCRGLCSLIPGRGSFGDIPGNEIAVFPPSLIVEPLERPWSSSIGCRKSGSRITMGIDTIPVFQFNKVLWFLHTSTGVSRAFFETGALNRFSSSAAEDLITRSMYLRSCISR